MYKESTAKKVSTALFAAIVAFALMIPSMLVQSAYAAADKTITVKAATTNHQYEAYQLFSGEMSDDGKTIGKIQWGSGVDSAKVDALIGALKGIELDTAITVKNTAGTESQSTQPFEDLLPATGVTAADVALVLNNLGEGSFDAELSKKVADVLDEYLSAVKSDLAPQKDANDQYIMDGTNYVYTAEVEDGWYYIKDKDGTREGLTNNNDSYTRVILQLTDGNDTIVSKSSVPTVTKEVLEDGSRIAYVEDPEGTYYKVDEDVYTTVRPADYTGATYKQTTEPVGWGDVADADRNQTINYRIKGTLPANFADYIHGYYYAFNDQMAAGLTYDAGSAIVVAYPDNDAYEADKDNTVADRKATGYALPTGAVVITDQADTLTNTVGQELKVGFDNLNDLTGVELTASSVIAVYYTAHLNENCVIGSTGNANEVDLTYSNNPNKYGDGDKGQTPKDYCVVFTYELDNLKTGEGQHTAGLPDAKFVLLNGDKDMVASFSGEGTTKKFEAWVPVSDAMENGEFKAEYKLVSDANGNFNINGLDEGAYTLRETDAPTGYAKLTKDIEFVITASVSQSGGVGSVDALDIYIGSHEAAVVEDGLHSDGYELQDGEGLAAVGQEITNTLSVNLPSTGGIGTTIFTIVGIALIAAAAIILVVRRRGAAAQQ